MNKQKFNVTGMTCSACSAHVEKAVQKVPGVSQVTVNLLQNSMQVSWDDTVSSADTIIAAVVDAGYGASLAAAKKAAAVAKNENTAAQEIRSMKLRLKVSFLFLIPLMYVSMGHMMGLPLPEFFHGNANAITFAFTQLLLVLPIMYINRKYYINGFKALFHCSPTMDSLIAVGSSAAVIYGIAAIYAIGWGLGHGDEALVSRYSMDLYFESAGTILTLITLGKFLEARSKGRTSDAIAKLMDLAPKTATRLRDGVEEEVPVEEVLAGDVLVVRTGQSIPVDGVVLEGSAAVDESAITGESLPVEKAAGDRVTGGTVSRSGYFTFQALRVGEDTTLAQIVRLVEDANSSKAPIAKLADRISGVFVPVVMTIALAAALIWLAMGYSLEHALSTGIAVLVVSCPCALGLATPTAIMVGTGKGAELGILYKTAESLENIHKIDTVVLDKTGTVTQGKPAVTDILPAPGVDGKELLRLAAAIEKPSEHPLAAAVVAKAAEENLTLPQAENFSAVAGQGVLGTVEGRAMLAGNLKMMEANGISLESLAGKGEAFAEEGKTPLFFTSGSKLLGIIAVADVVKPTSQKAIEELKKTGIHVVMLTGDNARTAEAIRRQVGVEQVIAEVLPQDKEAHVRRLQEEGHKVAMVGDGVNDAPALTRADVGVAIGAGTDIAIESADVVLMRSDLLDCVTAIRLGKAVIRNIKENLFWAFFYNSIGIPLAAGVFYLSLGLKLNPMFGAAAMSMSSVCVVSNALRLKLFKAPWATPAAACGGACPVDSASREKAPAAACDGSCPVDPAPQETVCAVSEEIKQSSSNEQLQGGTFTMEKKMIIEGMACGHCSARVEKALNAIDGVSATVDLAAKCATITLTKEVSDQVLTDAVTEAGYDVISIQ
ncbi:heavy metal translocating P-type ATPase [Angelakisella massiliensis]|uniref:heavy metal translocating P-type ATPase n=1 Tax=Angelakisella massiliensis TaxID=1871018 RepID=UPI0024B1EF62|nr:heavy metal translocating P-type ATPase [Angelakisella massiliensis]